MSSVLVLCTAATVCRSHTCFAGGRADWSSKSSIKVYILASNSLPTCAQRMIFVICLVRSSIYNSEIFVVTEGGKLVK